MKVLFATAELAPLTRVGGLGEASAGLVRELRALGVEVELVLPDYSSAMLDDEVRYDLDVPAWAGPARARTGTHVTAGRVTLIDAPGIARPHPYNDPSSGDGWPDNTQRFFAFSAALAALAEALRPDVLHVNDWHTAPALGMLASSVATVLTIHNLAYQGIDDARWLARLTHSQKSFARNDACNPLCGGIALADTVVTVSPSYAAEIVQAVGGFGLDDVLRARGGALRGILNGINTASWDPAHDAHLDAPFDVDHLEGKRAAQSALNARLGWHDSARPLVAMVTRIAEQKGIDFALETAPDLVASDARLVVLGSGDRGLAERVRGVAAALPDTIRFEEDFDEPLAHLIFAGADLLLMPSRFEPCGLTQMQAMAYGTIPIVTPVGGLLDTVRDADRSTDGNGFLAAAVDAVAVRDALRRAIEAWGDLARRRALQERGMRHDWSWRGPAREYLALYESRQRD